MKTAIANSDDADLVRRVELFLVQRQLRPREGLSISASHGVVTLAGTACTFHRRQLLVSAARRVAGVIRIVDELEVPPRIETRTRVCSSPFKTVVPAASALAVFLVVGLAGCGRSSPPRVETYPARGVVTYQGQPAGGAFIALHPKGGAQDNAPTPTAIVRSDGTYELTTYDAGDGLPTGEYVVTLQWRKATRSGNEFLPGPNLLPAKYSRPETSDIVVRVATGQNQLPPIALKR